MRIVVLFTVLLLAFALVIAPAKAWEPEDHEIFELQSALEASEGKGTTFYSILNLTTKATAQQIKTAYRKRSVELHPDKHPDNPNAYKRFERLGLVNKILRDARKDRYDHFLSTGFPKWRSTGYFYERFRPGLGSVIVGVIFLSALAELLVRRLNYTRDKKRLDSIRRNAFFQAWGPRFYHVLLGSSAPGTPSVPAEKKIKLSLGSLLDLPDATPSSDPAAMEQQVRRVAAQGNANQNPFYTTSAGRTTIDVLVTLEDGKEGVVWTLDDETGEWTELSEKNLMFPTLFNTWPVKVVRKYTDKVMAQPAASAAEMAAIPAAAPEGSSSATKDSTVKSRKSNGGGGWGNKKRN